MSFFKKPNRKFKQRSRADSDEEENDQFTNLEIKSENVIDPEPIPNQMRKDETRKDETKKDEIKKNDNKKDQIIKLSFEDEGEDVVEFKLKKSKSSLKAMKQQFADRRKETKKSNKQTEFVNQSKSVRKLMETNKECLEDKSIRQSEIINVDEIDLEDDNNDEDNYFKRYKKSTDPIQIYDPKTIEKFKRQRFLAKEQECTSSDYISLNSNELRNETDYECSASSRLVREDPSDKESICIDEENVEWDDDRVSFYTGKNDQKERIKEQLYNAQNEELMDLDYGSRFRRDDSKNEIEDWEREQIKKGIGLKQQRDLKSNDFNNILMTNQRNQFENPYDPPAFIKSTKSALTKDQFLTRCKEELQLINMKIDKFHNQHENIIRTINNIKEQIGN